MKLRIQDDSVRFRMTLRELEQLEADGSLVSTTQVPGNAPEFRYGITIQPELDQSCVEVQPFSILLKLTGADFARLAAAEEEGVYIRQEWTDEAGHVRKFIVFAEKDRPGSACVKPEAWIYEEVPGQMRTVREIPGKRGTLE